MQIDLTIVLSIIVLVIGICFGVTRLPQFRESSTKILKERLKERDLYIEELKVSNKRYQNLYNNLIHKIEEEPELPEMEGDLTNPENIKQVIASVLPTFADHLPKWAQGFAKNPTIAGIAIDYFAKHPEKASEILGKFMKPKEAKKSEGSTPKEESPIPVGAETW
jgi:hypothetical protein